MGRNIGEFLKKFKADMEIRPQSEMIIKNCTKSLLLWEKGDREAVDEE
jgi:hypothetical protein